MLRSCLVLGLARSLQQLPEYGFYSQHPVKVYVTRWLWTMHHFSHNLKNWFDHKKKGRLTLFDMIHDLSTIPLAQLISLE